MATITFDDDMPARCWMAPEIPAATYSDGLTTLPVWPTWWECSIQPASTAAREAPTAPPRASASSWTAYSGNALTPTLNGWVRKAYPATAPSSSYQAR